MDNEKLCASCKGITFDGLGSRYGYDHCSDIKTVRLEAERKGGCPLCGLIWWSLRYDHNRIFDDSQCIRLYVNPPLISSSKLLHRIEVLVASCSELEELGWANHGHGEWELGPPDSLTLIRSHLVLYGIRGDPAETVFPNKLVNQEPNSDGSTHLVLKWLESCLKCHENCPQNIESKLPTRVIDVGSQNGSNQPFLWIPNEHSANTRKTTTSSDKRGKYMALSYCWGQEPFLTTTSSTIEERKRGFSMDDLPQTVRDAVIVARRLSIPYLWVDALCIIQGSDKVARDDWKSESARMKSIYSGAFLTVSAACAENAYCGILKSRQSPPFPHCKLTYVSCVDPGVSGSVSLGPDHVTRHRSTEPLDRRAWALQEYFLSTRVLTYGTSELSWTCNCCAITESQSAPSPVPHKAIGSLERDEWCHIVEDYCSRELTRSMDKLPALSGLVTAFREASGDTYLAGLWMRDLSSQLLWQHCGLPVDGKHRCAQPSEYRAPSWSWASVNGRVKFHDLNDMTRYNARIINCNVISSAPYGLGLVSSGKLDISGFVMEMPTIRCEPSASYHGGYDNYLPWMCIHEGVKTFLDNVDSLRDKSRNIAGGTSRELLNSRFIWIGVKNGKGSKNEVGAGLILLKARDSLFRPVFRRVGMFIWRYPIPEFKWRMRRTITII